MGKIVAITGAGEGLGRAIARRVAGDGDGVALIGRTASKIEALAEELGECALAVPCDIADPDAITAGFAAIKERFETLDVLVNNAAIYDPTPLDEADISRVVQGINTNLTGAMLCARAAIPLMREGSHIFNVSSESVEINYPMLTIYRSSKAGLEQFTTSLAAELQPKGIRVTCLQAASMTEPGKAYNLDPQMGMRFMEAAAKNGLRLMEAPISQYSSVADLVRVLIDLPGDLHVEHVKLRARRA